MTTPDYIDRYLEAVAQLQASLIAARRTAKLSPREALVGFPEQQILQAQKRVERAAKQLLPGGRNCG